ncbi:uncharacterized protein LOC141904715 [Tubulanus polymorphus]|uniref:uncharacterized protein LOC141904715 n=1 Tax=Tubulanus polymorphus TaxID=672921 RepID=UPI003DA500CD
METGAIRAMISATIVIATTLQVGHATTPQLAREGKMLSNVQYIEEPQKTLIEMTDISESCHVNISKTSQKFIEKLIVDDKKRFIYMTLTFPRGTRTSVDYRKITKLNEWIWVENRSGKPLLELDFRFRIYSLTSLGIDVANAKLDVELNPSLCLNTLNTDEQMSVITHSLKNMILKIKRVDMKVRRHAKKLISSICYSRIASYSQMRSKYYVQKACCDVAPPVDDTVNHTMNTRGEDDDIKCEYIVSNYTTPYVVILYVFLFLVSPLLMKCLPEESHVYALDRRGKPVDISVCSNTAHTRCIKRVNDDLHCRNNHNNNNDTDGDAPVERDCSANGLCSHQNHINENRRNFQKVKFMTDGGEECQLINGQHTDPECPAVVGNAPGPSGIGSKKIRSANDIKDILVRLERSQNVEDIMTSSLNRYSINSSSMSDTDAYGISLQSLHSTLERFELEILDSNGNPHTRCNGFIRNSYNGLIKDKNQPDEAENESLNDNSESDKSSSTKRKSSIAASIKEGGAVVTEIIHSALGGDSPEGVHDEVVTSKCPCETCVSRQQFIALDTTTPVRINHPLRYMFLLHIRNDWICRFRRICFFWLLYPIFIHAMIGIDIVNFYDHISMLSRIEHDMKITGQLTDLEDYDYIWMGTIFTCPKLLIAAVYLSSYVLMTVILVIEGNVSKVLTKLMIRDEYLGPMKLPEHLQTPPSDRYGVHLLYHKMKYRLSLICEPRFWSFWLSELKRSVTIRNDDSRSICTYLKCPLRFITCVLSLALLLPLFNCFPWDVVIGRLKSIRDQEKLARCCLRRYKRKHFGRFLIVLIVMAVIILGVIFALLIFIGTCKIVSLFILYTIKGIVKHYVETLPVISIKVVALYYLMSTTHKLNTKYKEVKKLVFDECILKQNEIDERAKKPNDICASVLQRSKRSPQQPALVISRDDGVPLIPQHLYNHILDKHVPLRENELAALAKLTIIAVFLTYVGSIINVYNIGNVTSLGQAIATFFAVTFPKVFDFFNGKDVLADDSLKYKIRGTIKAYYEQNIENTSRDRDDDLHRDCENIKPDLIADQATTICLCALGTDRETMV